MSPDMGKPFDPGFNARPAAHSCGGGRWKPLEIGAMVARLRALLADRPRHPRLEVLAEEERLSGRSLRLSSARNGRAPRTGALPAPAAASPRGPGAVSAPAAIAPSTNGAPANSPASRKSAASWSRPSANSPNSSNSCAARATARSSTASCRSGAGGRGRLRSDPRADLRGLRAPQRAPFLFEQGRSRLAPSRSRPDHQPPDEGALCVRRVCDGAWRSRFDAGDGSVISSRKDVG